MHYLYGCYLYALQHTTSDILVINIITTGDNKESLKLPTCLWHSLYSLYFDQIYLIYMLGGEMETTWHSSCYMDGSGTDNCSNKDALTKCFSREIRSLIWTYSTHAWTKKGLFCLISYVVSIDSPVLHNHINNQQNYIIKRLKWHGPC